MNPSKSELAAKNLKTIQNYSDAIRSVRKRYFDQAKSQCINSSEQSQTIDQLLILDYMIESNQCILDYLNHFKAHQNALATKALEDVLSQLTTEEQENIHATVQRMIDDIMQEGLKVSEQLKDDYNMRGYIYAALTISFYTTAFLMGPILVQLSDTIVVAMVAALGAVGSTVFVFSMIALILVLNILAFICHYQTNQYAQPDTLFYSTASLDAEFGRMAECLEVRKPTVAFAETDFFKRSYERDFTTRTQETRTENHTHIETITVTQLYPPEKSQRVDRLREAFTRELAHEVAEEYACLTRPSM